MSKSYGYKLGLFLVAILFLVGGGIVEPSSDCVALQASGWRPPQNVSLTSGESRVPTVAVDSQGQVHIVWEEGRYVYHSYWNGSGWSFPWRITVGEQPQIAIDNNDVPHLVFVNEFRGNYEIYYCQWTGSSWTLPRNVSSTSGVSAIPDIAIDSRNTLHVVWTDNSPGYNVIYYGQWTGIYWINRPIRNARGSVSSAAVGPDDLLHVVWQDREDLESPYEVYHVQWDGDSWSLPENLSDSPNQSTIPSAQVDGDGQVHVTWEERIDGQDRIYYCSGQSFLWSMQEQVSDGVGDAYLPSIAVDMYGFPHLAWDEQQQIAYRWRAALAQPWLNMNHIAENAAGIADVDLYSRGQAIHAVWAERTSEDNWEIYYSWLDSAFHYPIRLPLVMLEYAGTIP